MERYTIKKIRHDLEHKRGEPFTDEVFEDLLLGFEIYAVRRGLYSNKGVAKARKRGWMTAPMARLFKNYAAQ